MRIVTGSGNSRRTLDFPHASVVNRSSEAEQKAGKSLLCNLLNINSAASEEKADAVPLAA